MEDHDSKIPKEEENGLLDQGWKILALSFLSGILIMVIALIINEFYN